MSNLEQHPIFEIVTTTAGVISIKNKVVNEIMHNPVGPWVEANSLYVEQSRLAEKLLLKENGVNANQEFVLFDVGLGAAANALAALHCAKQIPENQRRPFRVISFEKDLTLLEFALANQFHFAHFQGFQESIRTLLDQKTCSIENITWELREGNFIDCLKQEVMKPHLIFYDPYSPKVNQEMWTQACFADLKGKCRDHNEGGTLLLTYSQATKIRTAFLLAAFDVGYGLPTGLKEETTQAATDVSLLDQPLDQKWYQRWLRSHERYPFDSQIQEHQKIDKAIELYFNDKV